MYIIIYSDDAIGDIPSGPARVTLIWSKINWEDDEKSTNWCWDKFLDAARADNLSAPPALQRTGNPWSVSLRKENNAFRIILRENTKSTPEEAGEPIMILFAPKAITKFRSKSPDAKEQLCRNISAMYQGRYRLTEQLVTQEWAMIASLGNDNEVGIIPQHRRAQTSEAAAGLERAFVESIYEAGLRTQNYDKGFENFVRKFERSEAMSATGAVLQGHRNDYGWAVYFTQGHRRCLLLDTQDVPPPMQTRARKKASGAGSLRGVAGSGQTEIGVDHAGPPSKT
jgi:hypothetical protein